MTKEYDNPYAVDLYKKLMTLVAEHDCFYFQDFESPIPDSNYVLRVFNYRMSSYQEFMMPGGLECRGAMFAVGKGGVVSLVSLPMEKFFNLNENPSTMNLDLTTVERIEVKADGSLISTYILDDMNGNMKLMLKSKGSINSDQAMDAMKWLDRPENSEFKAALTHQAMLGRTVNLEWCAPFNRIVLPYQHEHLTLLNVRDNRSGVYIEWEQYPALTEHAESAFIVEDPVDFVNAIPDMEGIEGYIVVLANGQRVKIKTLWYLVQHRAKDSVNSDRRLFETVVCDAHDDLRSLFHDDDWVIGRINWMEELVGNEYNKMVNDVEKFYNDNKQLNRKDYAIKGQTALGRKFWFPLVMNLYLDKSNDYRQFMMNKWKEYGIKDQTKSDL